MRQGRSRRNKYPNMFSQALQSCWGLPLAKPNQKQEGKEALAAVHRCPLLKPQSRVEESGSRVQRGNRRCLEPPGTRRYQLLCLSSVLGAQAMLRITVSIIRLTSPRGRDSYYSQFTDVQTEALAGKLTRPGPPRRSLKEAGIEPGNPDALNMLSYGLSGGERRLFLASPFWIPASYGCLRHCSIFKCQAPRSAPRRLAVLTGSPVKAGSIAMSTGAGVGGANKAGKTECRAQG